MSLTLQKRNENQVQVMHTEKENFISYIHEPPSLQHIAAVSSASFLWSQPDVQEDVRQYSEEFGFDLITRSANKAYNEFAKRVLIKLADLHLPNTLECNVSSILKPIGLQLFKGFEKEVGELLYSNGTLRSEDKEYCRFYDIFKMGGSVYWTMEGVIDNVRSLKEVINNEDNGKDYFCLYELACKYCLEEYIPGIWRNVSSEKKNELDYSYDNYDYHIVAYWTAFVKGTLPGLLSKLKQSDVHNIYDTVLSVEQNMISLSIFIKNEYSLRYFWNKLNELERNDNLEKWLSQTIQAIDKYTDWDWCVYHDCNDKANILCFLLSQLTGKNEQKDVIQAHSRTILKTLYFYWPWQRFFLPTFSIMLEYISEDLFVEIMTLITEEIKKDVTLNGVFRDIWFKSSLEFKKSIIQFCRHSSTLLFRFLSVNDVESILMILKCATAEECKQILFEMIDYYELFKVIYSNKLNLIDTLVTTYLTNQDIIDFKHSVMLKYAFDRCKDKMCDTNFQTVKMLFAWGFKSPSEAQKFEEKYVDKNEMYISFVCEGNYELVNQFLNWFFESEDEVVKFKKGFIYEVKDNSPICFNLLRKLSFCKHGWELFERFVEFHFGSSQETAKLKENFYAFVTLFLDSYRFEFADKYINWCLGSTDEGNRFKNTFIMSERGINFLIRLVNESYPDWDRPNDFLKRFLISNESAAFLKSKLDSIEFFRIYCITNSTADFKRWAFMYLLDKYAGQNMNDSDNSDITEEITNAYYKKK